MSEVMEKRNTITVHPQRAALAEQWRQDWVVNAEVGTAIEDVLDPAYWSHLSAQFQVFDRIEVRMETGEWTADLIVTGVGRNWASMHLIQQHILIKDPGVESMDKPQYEVRWRGQQHRFCVVRLSDNEVIQANLPTKPDATAWLTNYEQVIRT